MSQDFSEEEKEAIFELVDHLAGTNKVAHEKPQVFLNNIKRRMNNLDLDDLEDYLCYAQENDEEYMQLISALTIHTTSWFRESRHFEVITQYFERPEYQNRRIRALSMGCSTGEEVYTLALTLESLRQKVKGFDYLIEGFDIDPISIRKATNAIYSSDHLRYIPDDKQVYILLGSGRTEGMMTLTADVRKRCHFNVLNALESASLPHEYDLVLCRNMLIYFNDHEVNSIVKDLTKKTVDSGLLILGHSENVTERIPALERHSGSVFVKSNAQTKSSLQKTEDDSNVVVPTSSVTSQDGTYDLLIVDDSKTILKKIAQIIEGEKLSYKTAETASEASQQIKDHKFNLIVLDLNLPDQNGDEWIKAQRKSGLKTPTMMISGVSSEEAKRILESLDGAAEDFFIKDRLFETPDLFVISVKSFVEMKKFNIKGKLPVVVVDDDRDVSDMYEEFIKEEGYKSKVFHRGDVALEYLRENKVQLIISDYMMPNMNGVQFAKEVRKFNNEAPIVLLTGTSKVNEPGNEQLFYRRFSKPISQRELAAAIEDSLLARYEGQFSSLDQSAISGIDLILIGGSTGGPQAFKQILGGIGPSSPPIVVVQHIQPEFQKAFGESLAKAARLDLKVVDGLQELQHNTIHIPYPDRHITIRQKGNQYFGETTELAPLKGHRPCVEYMFDSAARIKSKSILGIILTGMGDDGARGIKSLCDAGAYTIAQNITSSIVFGMPKVAIDNGGIKHIASIDEIREILRSTVINANKAA